MADLGKAYVQIVPSAKGLRGSVSSVLGPEASAAGTAAGGNAALNLASKMKTLLIASGIGAALVKSIKEGARYEQAVGGMETLFKGYSSQMIKYANEAYKTAGISANEYMEQSTSFAASLLQSVGGNAEKAGEAANQAVIDMADNANKMGTPLENIQNAYQGFAKGQYQLLDNLKLGYGGTKGEMERLLQDAQKITGQKYDINNLNDVYSAIHVIQGELGITGTTAKEAEATLSGSFQSMKAAASNFMAQLTTGGDVESAMAGLADSSMTFLFDNLVPALGKVIMALPSVTMQLIGKTIPKILNRIGNLLDSGMGDKGTKAAQKFGASFGKKLLPAVANLLWSVIKLVPKILISLPRIARNAAAGFVTAMRSKIVDGVRALIERVKSLFRFDIKWPHIPIPKLSISFTHPGGMWEKAAKFFGLDGVPKIGVKFAAKGGIVDGAALIAGEAGAEGIVPLDPFWKRLDNMVDTVVGNSNKGSFGVVQILLDGEVIGQNTINFINGQVQKYGVSPLNI